MSKWSNWRKQISFNLQIENQVNQWSLSQSVSDSFMEEKNTPKSALLPRCDFKASADGGVQLQL